MGNGHLVVTHSERSSPFRVLSERPGGGLQNRSGGFDSRGRVHSGTVCWLASEALNLTHVGSIPTPGAWLPRLVAGPQSCSSVGQSVALIRRRSVVQAHPRLLSAVEKFGRSRRSHKPEIAGSNPARATTWMVTPDGEGSRLESVWPGPPVRFDPAAIRHVSTAGKPSPRPRAAPAVWS